jgi:phospholipid/cholesterol/gamma-HCH transport system permease protein
MSEWTGATPMPERASLDAGAPPDTLVARGAWTLANAASLDARVAELMRRSRPDVRIDASGLAALDTAGVNLLLDAAGGEMSRIDGLDPRRAALLQAVAKARRDERPPPAVRHSGLAIFLARIGAAVEAIGRDAVQLVGFVGLMLATLLRVAPRPRRWRPTPIVAQIEQTGLDAVPIIVLLNFMVGAVIAFLGATVLQDFGASIFTVELVAYSFLREFGVLLTAILVAGRSGSAFTAQIGSMKAGQEIDALRTLGLDPIEVLVLPRAIALLVAMPLLTFIAMLAGILGGAIVCMLSLDISPTMFLTRMHDLAGVRHFWVGMSKAPLFAFLVTAIGCLEGFKVSGSAESVGRHTTSSVVQSIFVVILVDALAAIFFREMGW